MKKPVFADLYKLPEDERIDMIGHFAVHERKVVGFMVEQEGKADRYIEKLKAKFPTINIICKINGPTRGCITVKVGPPPDPARN